MNNTFELVLDNYSNVFKVSPTNASQQTTASILVANSTLIDYDTGPQTYQFNVSFGLKLAIFLSAGLASLAGLLLLIL